MADSGYADVQEYDPSAPTSVDDERGTSKLRSGLQKAGKSLSQKGVDMINASRDQAAAGADRPVVPSYKRGGIVRKTGLARVHKGERVIPKHKVKKVERALKKKKGSRGM